VIDVIYDCRAILVFLNSLLGMIPTNAGGFGDVEKAKQVFVENEVMPIQAKLLGLNAVLGVEAFTFRCMTSRAIAMVISPAVA
jgi:hypothetical protein